MLSCNIFKKSIKKCVEEILQDINIFDGVVLISGATGMIGSVILDCFLCMNDMYHIGYKVLALSRSKQKADERLKMYYGRDDFRFILCDVNSSLPDLGHVDYIIHAASNTHPLEYSNDPINTIRTNVIGTDNLLDYARLHHVKRFVFLSSVEIYGENKGNINEFSETDMGYLDCNTLRAGYPESKRVGESLCRAYEKKYGLDIIIPRICRVYGPTMCHDDSKALAQFIRKAINGQDIILKSKGQQYYSYIYVMDAVKAIFYIMYRGKSGEAYNVSSELSNIRLIELADKLAEIAEVKVDFEIPDEEEKQGYSIATKAILNNAKLKALGWNESYNIDSGLQVTMETLRNIENRR